MVPESHVQGQWALVRKKKINISEKGKRRISPFCNWMDPDEWSAVILKVLLVMDPTRHLNFLISRWSLFPSEQVQRIFRWKLWFSKTNCYLIFGDFCQYEIVFLFDSFSKRIKFVLCSQLPGKATSYFTEKCKAS